MVFVDPADGFYRLGPGGIRWLRLGSPDGGAQARGRTPCRLEERDERLRSRGSVHDGDGGEMGVDVVWIPRSDEYKYRGELKI